MLLQNVSQFWGTSPTWPREKNRNVCTSEIMLFFAAFFASIIFINLAYYHCKKKRWIRWRTPSPANFLKTISLEISYLSIISDQLFFPKYLLIYAFDNPLENPQGYKEGNSLSYNVALLCPFDCCIKYYLFYGILVTCAYNHFLKWWPLGKIRKQPVEDAFFLWTSLLLTYILTNPT